MCTVGILDPYTFPVNKVDSNPKKGTSNNTDARVPMPGTVLVQYKTVKIPSEMRQTVCAVRRWVNMLKLRTVSSGLAHDFQEKNLYGIYGICMPINICPPPPPPPEQRGRENFI